MINTVRSIALVACLSTFLYSLGQSACTYDGELHGELSLSATTLNALERSGSGDTLYIGLQYHVVSDSNQPYVPPPSYFLTDLNEMFKAHRVQFVHCGPALLYVHDAISNDWQSAPYSRDTLAVPGAINIFWTGGINSPVAGGFAEPKKDRVVISIGSRKSWVLAHEIGHVLGLPHTFDLQAQAELVDGSNCSVAGDLFCDTPADPGPNILTLMDSCTYVGTVTDANGDLYTPDLENLMSYAGHCTKHFSIEQGLRMYNVLENEKWYLQRYDEVVHAELLAPSILCANDSNAYPLVGTPVGGSFSGPGVVASTFTPALAALGDNPIAYEFSGIPDSLDLTRQYWGTILPDESDTLNEIWQSMRMENEGILLSIKQLVKLEQQSDLTLEVYAGTGNSGALLYTQTNTYASTAGFEWLELDVNASLGVLPSDTITYRITSNLPMIVYKGNLYFGGYYIHGECNWGVFSSHHFAAYVRALPPCWNTAYCYASVYEVEEGSILGLNTAYCVSGDSIELFGTPADGSFTIDNDSASVFRPGLLGLGPHTVVFTSADRRACVSSVEQVVEVEPFPVLFPTQLGPYCDSDPAQAHGASPGDGQFWVDGVSQDSIYPSQLSIGSHTASYYVEVLNDTVHKEDQQKGFVDGHGLWPPPQVQLDSTYWQSFTTEIGGVLDRVQMYNFNWQQQTFEVFLHAGDGLGGNVLFIDTLVFPAITPELYTDVVAPAQDIEILADSTYTVGFRWIAGPTFPPIYIGADTGDTYLGGRSNFDSLGIDMYFKEVVRQYRYCRDSVSSQFDVEDCVATGVEESTAAGVRVFPNPSSGDLYITSVERIERIAVFNSLGELVLDQAVNSNGHMLSGLASGYYTLSAYLKGERMHISFIVR